MPIKSLYCQHEVCVCVNGKQSKLFHVGVGLQQGCVLSPLLLIIYMNWMDKLRQTDECVTIGSCKISCSLYVDDLVLMTSSKFGLQHALNGFAAACDIGEMKISTSKSEILHLSRNLAQCSLQVGSVSLKQVEKLKYFGVKFINDEKQDEELDI